MNIRGMRREILAMGLAIGLAALLLLGAACSKGGSGSGGAPSIKITTPKDGSTVNAGDVKVTADTANLNVVSKLGQSAAPGEGHVHFFLDVDPPTTPGKAAVTAEGTYHAEATKTYTWKDVKPGTHKVSVELVNNDHTPLNPPVTATSTITVK